LVRCGRTDALGGWEGIGRRAGEGRAHCAAAFEEQVTSAPQMVRDMRLAGDA
jgi:hypothetical protein